MVSLAIALRANRQRGSSGVDTLADTALVANSPATIDGAVVLKVADLSSSPPTGRTRHEVGGVVAGPFERLAIAQYPSDSGFYLLYCDEEWRAITDAYHDTLERAIAQAGFEFERVEFVDVAPSSP